MKTVSDYRGCVKGSVCSVLKTSWLERSKDYLDMKLEFGCSVWKSPGPEIVLAPSLFSAAGKTSETPQLSQCWSLVKLMQEGLVC